MPQRDGKSPSICGCQPPERCDGRCSHAAYCRTRAPPSYLKPNQLSTQRKERPRTLPHLRYHRFSQQGHLARRPHAFDRPLWSVACRSRSSRNECACVRGRLSVFERTRRVSQGVGGGGAAPLLPKDDIYCAIRDIHAVQ
jgi:hypothetical protein